MNSKTEYFPEQIDEGLRGSLKPSSFFEDFVGNIQGAKLTGTELNLIKNSTRHMETQESLDEYEENEEEDVKRFIEESSKKK